MRQIGYIHAGCFVSPSASDVIFIKRQHLHQYFYRLYPSVRSIFEENRRQEADECEAGQHAQGICKYCISSR